MSPLRPGNRLFAALDLPDEARTLLAGAAAAVADAVGGRAVPAERLHVTLRFLGRVPPESGEPLATALRAACAAVPGPLRLRRGGLVARPGRGRARLVAQELRDEDGAFAALHAALGPALGGALGRPLAEVRPWPHVTLVRFSRPVRIPAAGAAAAAPSPGERAFDVSRATLYDSVQIPGRPPRYDTVAGAALGAPNR